MKKFFAKRVINAPARDVWDALVDVANYPSFDPNCEKIIGEVKLHQRLKIYTKQKPKKVFRVKVVELAHEQVMVWQSKLPFDLFQAERKFVLLAKDDFTSEIQVSEVFSGWILQFFEKKIPNSNPLLEDFVQGLKEFFEDRD